VTATFTKSNTVGLDVAVLYDDSGGGAGGAQITHGSGARGARPTSTASGCRHQGPNRLFDLDRAT
jgi:hypothetical protein